MILLATAPGIHIAREIPCEADSNCCCYETWSNFEPFAYKYQRFKGEILLQWQ